VEEAERHRADDKETEARAEARSSLENYRMLPLGAARLIHSWRMPWSAAVSSIP
jgi:hypothetical protein